MKYKIPTIKWNKICNQIHMTKKKKKKNKKKNTQLYSDIFTLYYPDETIWSNTKF